jgi:hypothetical protein
MRTRTTILAGVAGLALALTGVAQGPYGDLGDLKILKPDDKEHVKPTPPPRGAVVLFDGKDLEGWARTDGKTPAAWKVADGVLEVKPGSGNIVTKEKFDGKFLLHVEFRVPYLPEAKGQARGNSGVYVQGRYEVQVLDSYGLPPKDNECGGIYGIAAPRVNACKAPTVWQSYDITFTAPVCEQGKKVKNGRMTVLHNGVKIHDNVEITKDNTTAGLGGDPCTPGPIMLQDHGSPVQFRNVWLMKLEK